MFENIKLYTDAFDIIREEGCQILRSLKEWPSKEHWLAKVFKVNMAGESDNYLAVKITAAFNVEQHLVGFVLVCWAILGLGSLFIY